MELATSSIGFIRGFFKQDSKYETPKIHSFGYSGLGSSYYGTASQDYMMSTYGAAYSDFLRMDNDLVGRYIDYEDMADSSLISSCLDIYCLSGDTVIPMMNGKKYTMRQLAEEKDLADLWTYSCEEGRIVPGKLVSAQKTGFQQKLISVILDDGTKIKCTANHKFMMRDGSWKEAKDLAPCDSLMPLYKRFNKRGYEEVYDGEKWALTNIKLCKENNLSNDTFHSYKKRLGFSSKAEMVDRLNHKVKCVIDEGIVEDVYDLTIDGIHNFAAGTESGWVIVHNSDDASIPDHTHKKSIWVTSDDSDIADQLNDLLDKRLNIEEKIWGHLRSLCMYGNLNLEQVVVNMEGVKHVNFLPAPLVRKIEIPRDNKIVGYIFDQTGSFKLSSKDFVDRLERRMNGEQPYMDNLNTSLVYEDWEVVHMKLQGRKLDEIYGHGVADGARWVFKRLTLLEDSILLHRLTRAPGRLAFYVDVSNIPPNETMGYLNQVKAAVTKKNYINPETGKFDHRYDVMSGADNFYLPVRGGVESTRVESLAGPVYDHIEDVKFFENKLFAALKVPKPFLTYEESTAKTNLSAEDARFARTIMRVQREYRNGIKKICDTHLAAKRINPDNVDYKINMTVPSAVFELAQLEIKNAQLELANNFKSWAPKYWIMTEILHFSDDEIATMEEMRLMEIETGDGSGGGPSGAIRGASEKRRRPTPPTEAPGEAPPTPEWRQERNSDKYLMDGNSRKLSDLKMRVEDLRRSNKDFDKTLKRIENYSRDLQSALRK